MMAFSSGAEIKRTQPALLRFDIILLCRGGQTGTLGALGLL